MNCLAKERNEHQVKRPAQAKEEAALLDQRINAIVTASVVATRPAAIEISMVLNTAAGPYVSHAAHSAAMRMMAARMCMAVSRG